MDKAETKSELVRVKKAEKWHSFFSAQKRQRQTKLVPMDKTEFVRMDKTENRQRLSA